MCLKCKEEVRNSYALVNLIDDDLKIAFVLFLFAINLYRRNFVVFGIISFFFKDNMKRKKSHNMLCLMLNPRFKSLHFVSFFIGCEEVNIVKEYDRLSLYPMLLKCYYYLHPMAKSEVECANHTKDAKFDLDILKQTPNISESTTDTKEMLIFRCYQVDSKELKCLLEWWAKHETMFITLIFWPKKS
jgi:hypothetical protein